jgi:D-proline reductase (dithiol) PrdB
MELSRRCVPYTPLFKPLEKMNISIVTTARELAEAGVIGGVSKKHIALMGYTMRLKKVYDETVPAIAKELERSNTDGVILTAG